MINMEIKSFCFFVGIVRSDEPLPLDMKKGTQVLFCRLHLYLAWLVVLLIGMCVYWP